MTVDTVVMEVKWVEFGFFKLFFLCPKRADGLFSSA